MKHLFEPFEWACLFVIGGLLGLTLYAIVFTPSGDRKRCWTENEIRQVIREELKTIR